MLSTDATPKTHNDVDTNKQTDKQTTQDTTRTHSVRRTNRKGDRHVLRIWPFPLLAHGISSYSCLMGSQHGSLSTPITSSALRSGRTASSLLLIGLLEHRPQQRLPEDVSDPDTHTPEHEAPEQSRSPRLEGISEGTVPLDHRDPIALNAVPLRITQVELWDGLQLDTLRDLLPSRMIRERNEGPR